MQLPPTATNDIERAFDAGWLLASKWAERDDLHADMDSPAYQRQRAALLAEIAEAAALSGREAVGEIDEGEDGMFATFYPDRDLRRGAKLYTTPQPGDGWIDRAAHAADELLSTVLEGFEPERSEHGLGTKHLAWMACELAEKRIDSPTKACRWLGYIQGALVQIGLTSLRAEKLRNQASAAPSAKGVA